MNIPSNSSRELLFKLVSATDEVEIEKIVESNPILNNENNWKPYGEYHGNFNTIHNQQQNSVAALAEKAINSIDHLLLKECKLNGIDPESEKAPKSMQEATELFFKIKKGDFSEMGQTKRRELAKNIMIIAEGVKSRPTLTVVDNGEGQKPDDFEHTFVSLHRGNKDKIRFVQGKYNMGGTGVLTFCGEYHYQVILSRKTPELLQPGANDEWGFTLVRLHIVTSLQSYKNSWYEYCVNDDGKIFRFLGEPLNILPGDTNFTSGTYIRMFNYDLPNPSIITLDLWRDLDRILHAPAMPLLLHERRDYKGHSISKVMLGNKVRIMVDDKEGVDQQLTLTAELGKFGKRNIEISVFKEAVSKSEFTTQEDAIFFTINGQTHATIGRSFLRTKAGLYYLADHLLLHIDCTDVDTNVREQTFMPNRERMTRNYICKEVEGVLAEELSKHEGLKKLNQLRRQNKALKNVQDTKFLEGVVSNLIKNNHSLVNYLGLGKGVKDITAPGKVQVEKYEGVKFPTYLKIQNYGLKDKVFRKQMPINSYVRLYLETNATNDYLDRESESGKLVINPDISRSHYLYNGVITIKLVPPKQANVCDVIPVQVELTRPYQESLFVDFEIEYSAPIQPQVNPPRPNDGDKVASYKLPSPILVYKEKKEGCASWDEQSWSGQDIAKVAPAGDSNGNGKNLDIFLNMDADILRSYIYYHKLSSHEQELVEKLWETSIYLNSLVLYNDLSQIEQEELLPDVMKSIAKITLDLMHNQAIFAKSVD